MRVDVRVLESTADAAEEGQTTITWRLVTRFEIARSGE